jgi:hypothetical protein
MRVTSALWVAAFVRRCNNAGTFAVVQRRGAEEAGAIFILVDRLAGTADLYGPAPQTSFDEARPSDRRFQKIAGDATAETVDARLAKEARFDPDFWVVAVEDREGRTPFDTVAET